MRNYTKRLLCAVMSISIAGASNLVLPLSASAETEPMVQGDTVLNEWKFDFGAADSTAEDGFTLVTPDRNYVTEKDYGFLGIDEESYKLGDRLDGFGNQQGQVIELEASEGGIGSVGEDDFGNSGEEYYPVRFALKVEDETYYRVRATVTTLDPSKDAEISLYTERKHPIFTDKKISAGETYTADFTIRVTPIYYEKSEPKGVIADEMVNVCVLGENSALAKLEIQQVETAPTFWVLGDSTVTDGNCSLPFFRLQNYTGVGTGLTKYLPSTVAMVNEGEGGLIAADNNHFNMVKDRIKAGDYMYVEYGHNHKADSAAPGADGYKGCLDKYYDACHSVGADLIIVSPIERINTWDGSQYAHTLRDFAQAGEAFVQEKLDNGATDIAYVDLNKYSLDFYNKIVADNGNDANAIKYYFRTPKGGGTDTTHPNDAGAENLAYEFFKAAQAVTDETQKAVLKPILDNLTDETPTLVSAEIMAGGVGGAAWPQYVLPVSEKYPVKINDIEFNENGEIVLANVTVQDASTPFNAYGIIVITIKNADGEEKGKVYAVDQVDNSTGKGEQTITNFTKDVILEEGDTYSAVVVEAEVVNEVLQVKEDGAVYSAVYTPTDIIEQLLYNEDKDGNEDFDYYGATYDGATSQLKEYNNWTQIGSAGITLYLNETDDGMKYAELTSDGAKNGAANQGSFYISRNLDSEIGTTGRYVVSADMQYVSGGGMTYNLVTGHSDKNLGGTGITLFTVGDGGAVTINGTEAGTVSATSFTNVKYVLDMDLGTAELTVGANDPVTVQLENYQTTDLTVTPEKITQFMFGGSKVAFDIKVANLTVAKLKDQKLPEYTLTVAANNDDYGSVSIATEAPTDAPTEAPTDAPTAAPTQEATATEDPGEVIDVIETTDTFDTAELPEGWFGGTVTDGKLSGTAGSNKNDVYFGKHITTVANAADMLIRIQFEYKSNSGTASGNDGSEIGLIAYDGDDVTWNQAYNGLGVSTHIADWGMTDTEATYLVEFVVDNAAKTITVASAPMTAEGETVLPEPTSLVLPSQDLNINTFYLRPGKNKTDTIDNVVVTGVRKTPAEVIEIAESGASLSYADGKVTVSGLTDYPAVLVEAAYDNNNILTSFKATELNSASDNEVAVAEGSKIMLINSFADMKPLAAAITAVNEAMPTEAPTATPTAAPTEAPTGTEVVLNAEINTVVTVCAEAKEGYVFMGWKDKNDNIVSESAEYKFRLRGDTNLIANFVKEPGVESVTNYGIEADKMNIKAAEGSTASLSIVDAVDAIGTPVSKVTNTDATWSCDEPGVTVSESGVVTIGSDFAMDANTTKNITVKAVLNGIEKTCTLTVYSYAYYEKMSDATNFNGTIMTIAGSDAIVFPAGANTNTYTMSESVNIDVPTKITYKNAWSGSNTCGQNRTLNFKDADGNVVLTMYYSWGGLFVNGTELKGAVSQDTWTDVVIEINGSTAKVTAAGSSMETSVTGTSISQIDLVSAKSAPGPEARALGISEIIFEQ